MAKLQAQTISDKLPRCTVGTFLEEIFCSTNNRRTVEGYATAFRTIVSDSFGLSSDQKKYDSYHGGRGEWLVLVHSIALDEVTPARIRKWKQSFLANRDLNPFARLEFTLNSLMRRARSPFSQKILRHLHGFTYSFILGFGQLFGRKAPPECQECGTDA